MIIENNRLVADEGKILTNGEIYSEEIYLGIYDSIENWHEIDKEEMSQEQ